jgi:hypothetical protein
MDVTDKHQELVIVTTTASIGIPIELAQRWWEYQSGIPGIPPIDFAGELKRNGKIVPEIAFPEFGGLDSEVVSQGLLVLHNFTCKQMGRFYDLSDC